VKAFTANDFIFFDSSRHKITELTEAELEGIAVDTAILQYVQSEMPQLL
jgi:hypothetical protein